MYTFFSLSERKTKKIKSTPIEKRQSTQSSSWQQDTRAITDLPEAQQSLVPEYRNHWHQIRTRFSRKNRLLDWYNYRLSSLQPQELITHQDNNFTDQSTVFKLNVSFGFNLRNNETGALQYYYAPRNNSRDEKLDLLHFWHESKVKSNMVLALTSPLTRVKDVAKYISSLLTPLTSVKVKSNW